MNGLDIWELGILETISEWFHCPALDWLMPKITLFGDAGIFWIAMAVVFLCFPKTRKTGLMMGIAFLFGYLFGNILLKNLFHRIRPYDLPGVEVQLLVKELSDFSFPSGHTLVCFEAATVLMVRARRSIGPWALALAITVAFSRLYLFVHYPTDVLGGMLLGIGVGFIGVWLGGLLYDKLALVFGRRRAKKQEPTPRSADEDRQP